MRYWSEVADFVLSDVHVYCVAPVDGDPWEFYRDPWYEKTRS